MDNLFNDSDFEPKLSKKRNRVFAALIDLGLTIVVGVVMALIFGDRYEPIDGGIGYKLTGTLALIPLLFWFLITPLLEGIRGQSLGKMALKIKVISKDFSKATFWQVIVRHLFDIVDWIPGFGIVGLLVASNNKYSQRVGDLVAKTIVVQN